jgi:hypothetical protein
MINNNNYTINRRGQVVDMTNGKVAVAMTQIPEEYDTEFWCDEFEFNNVKKTLLTEQDDLEYSKNFTDPKLIKAVIEFQVLTDIEKNKLYIKIEIENHRRTTNNDHGMMENFYDVISKYNLYNFTSDEVFEIIASIDEEERELLCSIYLKNGFLHLGVVWIEARQYIKIYNDDYDYIQKYVVSKEYKKGYFKLFLPKS